MLNVGSSNLHFLETPGAIPIQFSVCGALVSGHRFLLCDALPFLSAAAERVLENFSSSKLKVLLTKAESVFEGRNSPLSSL